MQACWKLGRTTIRDILLEIADRPPAMSYTTVHMLLTRIVEKGYIVVQVDVRGSVGYGRAFREAFDTTPSAARGSAERATSHDMDARLSQAVQPGY